MKKLAVPLLLIFSFLSLVLFQSFKPGPQEDGDGDGSEIDPQNPPVVESISVQKLAVPMSDGANMKIKVVYASGYQLPAVLNITTGTDMPTVLRDDGTGADEEAGDGAYTGYLVEDIANFISNIETAVSEINARGGYISFTGHKGEFFGGSVSFDAEAFWGHDWVTVEAQLEPFCNYGVTRQQSLFITDLAVVENSARTYNLVTGSGNINGAWTFGTLMRNIINTGSTSIDAKTFLKNWVRTFTNGGTAKNGQQVAGREKRRVLNFMIIPWLNACGVNTSGINGDNWETYWGYANGEVLLQKAPFKLTAIVNRLDLRQNTGYMRLGNSTFNAGETRFIFTLINNGQPPVHDDQGLGFNALDWEGMNVIFEYGNVQTDLCALKAFGEQWQNLSTLTLGSSQFNDALEQITNTVTAAGAAPSKPNGSAINQIRTNERVLAYIPETRLPPWREWDKGFWELRQYELNNAGQLVLAPVTNTPTLESNTPANIDPNSLGSPTQASLDLLDWMNLSSVRKSQIFRGAHKIPDAMLAGSAIVNYQYSHYWDVPWEVSTPHYNSNTINGNNPTEKQMRQQLSLNTCQGCHTGESKTMFAHVIPRGYGASADYWSDPPYAESRNVDDRDFNNDGTTFGVPNYVHPGGGNRDRVIVSSFLTGRNYTNNQYTDDDDYDPDDHNMYGLFYVNDPNNTEDPGDFNRILPIRRWGYNDLLRRHEDLCKLVNNSCNNTFAAVAQAVRFQPFAVGSH